MINIDFFFRACLSTLELLKRHEFVQKGVVEVEGFFKFVALYAGGEYTFNAIRSARGVTRDEWKRISLYGTTNFEDIRAEWFMDDISEFKENDLLLAMIIFGDLLVHPECADDYVNCPTKLHDFVKICEFKLDYIITMRSILNTFLEEMKQAQTKLPENQNKFWAYTSEEERIVYSVEARKSGIPVNVLIQLKQLEADQKAREELEKQKKRKRKRVMVVLSVIAVLILGGYFAFQQATNNTATPGTMPRTTHSTSGNPLNSDVYSSWVSLLNKAQATATPKPATVYNGRKFITPEYSSVCPLTIKAGSDSDYYIYLKYQKAPTYSQESRKLLSAAKAPYESDIAFIVKAGQSYKLDVPIGVYKLYYATGDTFFNTSILFGDTTQYYEADDLLTFNASGDYYNGHSITLYKVANGNMDTDEIPEKNFPTR